MSRRDVHNGQDVIDSRDVIARIKELEDLIAEDDARDPTDESDEPVAGEDEREELRVLLALQDEASGSPDWQHGETLISDSYFETYAQELAEDIGAINRDSRWPNDCIDWEKAAEALQQDYMSVEFDGVTYWIRS